MCHFMFSRTADYAFAHPPAALIKAPGSVGDVEPIQYSVQDAALDGAVAFECV